MASATEPALFLDTSIQIARLVHSAQTKEEIHKRLSRHVKTITSLVVRQEFKRRLLKEAEYLLRLLHRYESFDEVHHHVIRLFGSWPGRVRKRNICLQTLAQIHATTDAERTERLQLFLRSLLVGGLQRFDQMVDTVRNDSCCACGLHDVVEKVKLRKYDLGPEKCSKTRPGSCRVVEFFSSRKPECECILEKLRSLPEEKKSAELCKAEKFLEHMTISPSPLNQHDPCLTLGDLFIALESAGVSHFFTLNSIESQHLCRALDQSLIVRPIDPSKPEVVCAAENPSWPAFGS